MTEYVKKGMKNYLRGSLPPSSLSLFQVFCKDNPRQAVGGSQSVEGRQE
jgi:hypothetical protein